MQDLTNEITTTQEYALELRKRGYNCSQCVLMSLSPYLDIKENLAARIAAAYGVGFGGAGEMCGALAILGVAEGLMTQESGPQDKFEVMSRSKALLDKFSESNNGRYLCRDLKGKAPMMKCPDLIKKSIELFIQEHKDIIKPKDSESIS